MASVDGLVVYAMLSSVGPLPPREKSKRHGTSIVLQKISAKKSDADSMLYRCVMFALVAS